MTQKQMVALVPRDGIFCKDGKGWHTSASGRGHGLEWPWPSTVLGALRTAWGRAEEKRTGAGFGPDDWRERTAEVRLGKTVVVRRLHGAGWTSEQTTWPVPRDAMWLEGQSEVRRLEPVQALVPTLGRDDDVVREGLWWPVLDGNEKPLPPARWWSHEDFTGWLAGETVAVRSADRRALARRVQVHVGIDASTFTADESVLFSHDVTETLESDAEWALGVEVSLPHGELPRRVARLGSDGRIVRIEDLPPLVFEPPARVLSAFRRQSMGLRVVVTTPTCFERGWLPDGLTPREDQFRGRLAGLDGDLVLRAAFVPRPVDASGWDMAAGKPKPTSRMVAPGAVYFFERACGRPFVEADASSLWLTALGSRTDEGFGRVVPGVWNPRRSTR